MRNVTIVAHNIRSTHNIGSLLRTCDGFGVKKVYLTGYTPYPEMHNDARLPHLAIKIDKQIHKTALGAEKTLDWEYRQDVLAVIEKLRADGYLIVGLEQADNSVALPEFRPPNKLALLLGSEVDGLSSEIIDKCSELVEVPMFGHKESFNVTIAAAIALYHVRFFEVNSG